MSNNNDDDEYNEDFSEGEQEFPPRGETPDGDDEQHAQKVNGKMDALRSEVESLNRSLSAATQKIKDLNDDKARLDRENLLLSTALQEKAAGSGSSDKQTTEINNLKKKNELLKEQLDSAMSISPATCPPLLKQEFLKFCKGNEAFKDLKDKDLTLEMCAKILKTQKSGSTVALAAGLSLDGGASQASLFSTADTVTSKRIKQLEHELKLSATSSTQDVQSLRAKVIHMNERIRMEKEYKYRAESEVQVAQKKVDMLGSHMEKLIVHLKHEGAHKLRLAEQLRVSERENAALTDKCDLISRKSAAKDRLILELREGSKVLEDQLRLMDEKYMELRTKLDYARELGVKKIKKAEKTASELRVKFAMYNGSAILDAIPLPTEGSYGDTGQWGSNNGNNYNNNNNHTGGMLMPPHSADMRMGGGGSPISRSKSGRGRGGVPSSISVSSSMNSLGALQREPTMDGVLEKIRKQEGRKQEWTQDKLMKLANGKQSPAL